MPYESPEITLLGSVSSLTRADLLAPGGDNLGTLLGGSWGGGDDGGDIYS